MARGSRPRSTTQAVTVSRTRLRRFARAAVRAANLLMRGLLDEFGRPCSLADDSGCRQCGPPGAECGGHRIARWRRSARPSGARSRIHWALPGRSRLAVHRRSASTHRTCRCSTHVGLETWLVRAGRRDCADILRQYAACGAPTWLQNDQLAPCPVNPRRPPARRIPVEQLHQAPKFSKAPDAPRHRRPGPAGGSTSARWPNAEAAPGTASSSGPIVSSCSLIMKRG